MDSVTQVVLGAAVGEITLGDKEGRRGALWGGLVGVVPDLDVLAGPFLTDVEALTFHRGISHSLFAIALLTPLIAGALRRWRPDDHLSFGDWSRMSFWVLSTHIFLDCLTTYGTQIFQPFSAVPVSISSVFVIDPLYSLPLAAGLLAGLLRPAGSRLRIGLVTAGLLLSTLYLGAGLAGKLRASHVFHTNLEAQGIEYTRLRASPAPFNTILWWGLAETDEGYRVGLYSLLDPDADVSFVSIPRNDSLLHSYRQEQEVQKLLRFSQGYYRVEERDGALFFSDLRFGRSDVWLTEEAPYVFTWELIPDEGEADRLAGIEQRPNRSASAELLKRYGRRILGQSAPLER